MNEASDNIVWCVNQEYLLNIADFKVDSNNKSTYLLLIVLTCTSSFDYIYKIPKANTGVA